MVKICCFFLFISLFNFLSKDDFTDKNECCRKGDEDISKEFLSDNLVEHDSTDVMSLCNDPIAESRIYDADFDESVKMFQKDLDPKQLLSSCIPLTPQIENCNDKLHTVEPKRTADKSALDSSHIVKNEKKISLKNSKSNQWIELFVELDPLANLDAFDLKISGNNKNSQQT